MADYQITSVNATETLLSVIDGLEPGKVYDVSINERNIGKWSLSRLWRSWVGTVADWMASQGATMPLFIREDGSHYGSRPFNAQDAHELFTMQLLGCDENGRRLSWSKAGRDGVRPASKGERLLAMQKLEAWATERGIRLLNPRDSDYRKLIEESER